MYAGDYGSDDRMRAERKLYDIAEMSLGRSNPRQAYYPAFAAMKPCRGRTKTTATLFAFTWKYVLGFGQENSRAFIHL